LKLDLYSHLVEAATMQPRLAAGLASSGVLAMMLLEPAPCDGNKNSDATDGVRSAAWLAAVSCAGMVGLLWGGLIDWAGHALFRVLPRVCASVS
jgi:hypothetical protein